LKEPKKRIRPILRSQLRLLARNRRLAAKITHTEKTAQARPRPRQKKSRKDIQKNTEERHPTKDWGLVLTDLPEFQTKGSICLKERGGKKRAKGRTRHGGRPPFPNRLKR